MPPAASFLQKARQKPLNKGFVKIIFFSDRCEHGGRNKVCESDKGFLHISNVRLHPSKRTRDVLCKGQTY